VANNIQSLPADRTAAAAWTDIAGRLPDDDTAAAVDAADDLHASRSTADKGRTWKELNTIEEDLRPERAVERPGGGRSWSQIAEDLAKRMDEDLVEAAKTSEAARSSSWDESGGEGSPADLVGFRIKGGTEVRPLLSIGKI
jgi:hypothetical protein